MKRTKTVMITWLLLVSLFCESIQDKNGKESGVSQCGPQNLKLTGSDQTILATWEDGPSCSTVRDVLIYEVVLLTDQEVYTDEVVVMLEQIGSPHTWNWTLSLASECVSHTVRIRSQYNNYTSLWMQESLPGRTASSKPEVYPKGKLLAVNSTVTFCCILPAGDVFKRMYLTGYDSSHMKATQISNQTYVLTVLLDKPSTNTCTDVNCESSSRNGGCAWISYPPGDRDLQCETRDVESVDCYWTVVRETHLPKNKISTKYQLNGRNCPDSSEKRCSLKVEDEAGERNWTLMAQNELGKVELTDRADLMKRVHMFAPVGVSASAVNARNVTLRWEWEVQRYYDLNITCQIEVSHGETSAMSEAFGIGLRSAIVMDLTPNWNYSVTVRCGTTKHLWKWGNWSTSVNFQTRGDIPDAVDVWMQMKDNQTYIVWKELQPDQSHGDILKFEVSWSKTTDRHLQTTTLTEHNRYNVSLSVDPTEEYIVTVTARNMNGSSSPSTIIIPGLKPERTTVNTSRINGSSGGFNLSWSASSAASCGYIVDWCPTSGSCRVEWLKVFPNQTNARIVSNFEEGQRYLLSVYACTHTAPVLLEKQEGYIKEKRIDNDIFRPLKWKQQDSNVEVSWDSVPLRSQSAFIIGYALYCEDKNNRKIVCNVSTDNPEATSLTATNLKISTYSFTVKAKTAAGECGASSITGTLNSLTDNLIEVVIISLVAIFGLLSLITILCYRSWSCIKHKVYPPIPRPMLTDKWLTMGDIYPLHVNQYLHSEAAIMDVPELQCKLRARVRDYLVQENLPYVSAQPLKSYYNQSVKSCISQPLSLPTTAVPPQSGLPPPPFKSLIQNPSYSLSMEVEPYSSSPEPEKVVHSEVHCDGYQPQNQTANLFINQMDECTDSPMSCVFTYVLLPQSPTI